jgi:hypothetical protein
MAESPNSELVTVTYLILNGRHFILTVFIAALTLALISCASQKQNRLLESPKPAGFEQIGPVTVYNKTTLFDFMDGEAEVYFPFGFRLLYTLVYTSEKTDARMSVEIYDMASEQGASDVYRHYSAEGGSTLQGIGRSAWTDRYLLLFTEGPYFVRISPDPTKENKAEPTPQDMIALAHAVDGLLK